MSEAAKAANPNLEVIYEVDSKKLERNLFSYLRDGDTILVKASHFMHYERLVQRLEQYKK